MRGESSNDLEPDDINSSSAITKQMIGSFSFLRLFAFFAAINTKQMLGSRKKHKKTQKVEGHERPGVSVVCLIAELKAVRATAPEHVAQILGYLRASRIEHGLLINFGAPVFFIKKYIKSDVGEA